MAEEQSAAVTEIDSEPVANSVSTTPSLASAGVTVYETGPDSITWHKIWDYELDTLTNISRPLTLAISTMLIGAGIGLVAPMISGLEDLFRQKPDTVPDLAYLVSCVICVGVGVTVGIFAAQGQLDAHRVKVDIRNRSRKAL